MSSVNKLFKLAEQFARKISLAQAQMETQPAQIEQILQSAGLWDKSNEVSPLLNAAGVDDGPVAINFQVDPQLNVKFMVTASPPAAVIKLTGLLKNKYAAAMKAALAKAGASRSAPVDIKWLTF